MTTDPSRLNSPVDKRHDRNVRACCLAGCLLPVVTVVAAAVVFLAWQGKARREAEAKIAAIRAAGEPASGAELNGYYRLPEGTADTAGLWIEAMAALSGPTFEDDAAEIPLVGHLEEEEDRVPPPGEAWEKRNAVEAFLDKYTPSLDLMHEAADKGGAARYPIDFTRGFDTYASHLDCPCRASRLLTLQARTAAYRGDTPHVVRSVRTMFRLAESLRHEPTIVSQLVRYAVLGIACGQLNELPAIVELSGDDLALLAEELARIDLEPGFHASLLGERAVNIDLFLAGDAEELGFDRDGPGLIRVLPHHEDLCLYLDQMDAVIAAAKLPPPADRAEAEALRDGLQRTFSADPFAMARYPFASTAMAGLYNYVGSGSRRRTEAVCLATRVSLAVRRHSRQHGELPKTMRHLVPEYLDAVPTDPFDGKPMRYVVEPGGYMVYSVGEDQTDDDGFVDQVGADVDERPTDVGVIGTLPRRSEAGS